ncbi:MAG: hypothetical protein IKK50_02070, partial [Ruminiclostridium sp.]|nr:hypothetical protein [Ruminiclostridium sp.]
MALTDAQAKIIAENRKKKETEKALAAAAAAKILASSTTKKSPSTILDQRASSRPYSPMLTQQVYRPSGTLKTPLNYLQEAAAQKITTQDRISAAKRSGAVRGDYQRQWQKNKATAVERIAQRRERDSKQTLSEYDSKLPRTAQDRIRSYKTQWGLAKEAGDTAGMKTAHALAEQVRARAGYSGGVTGDEFLTADLTDREKLTLNQVGQNKLKMAKLAQKQAFEAKDAKALQEATEEMARIMSAPGYRNQAAVGDTDAHGRSKMPGSPDAQMDAEQALAILKAAGYGTAGAFAALMESSRKALNSRDPWGVKAAKDKALKNLADYDLMDSDDPQKQQWGRELAAYRKQKEQEELQTWMDDLNAKRLEYLGESYASGLITWEDYQERREELLRETMTDGQWLMYQSQKNLAKAAEGQSMAGQFGTNTLVSGLQQLPGMAAALIPVVGPAVSLAYLGAMAAGQKAYELDQRGIEPGEVFTRSFLSAGVEVLTEKIPLGAMLDIVKKGGGENFLKALGKTLGLNFTEESLAYTGNWLLDKAYEDPEAKFSLAEMAANGLAGALIGGTASVGGAAVMGGGTRKATTPQSASQTAPLAQGSLSGLPQEEAEKKTVLPTAEEAERQQRAAQANTELERSGILAGAEEETIRRVGDLARKLNREVRFFRGESWENGRYDPNTGILHLNTNGRNPIMQIFAHELTHSIETAESYDKLVGAILKTMDDAELNERFQEITQRYQEKGVFLEDPAEVMHEVVAEYVETRLLTNYEDILSLVQTDRSLGQRILEWIDSMLAKLGSTAAQERAALTEAREMYARALQETNEGGATMVPPQTPSSGLTRAPQGAHAQTEGTIPQSASQTAPFAQGSLLEESGPKGEKGWEDLPHDPYMQALGEQLRSGEISEEEFDRRFDEYYHGGSEVFDYDTEETTLPMKYSFADQRRETPPDTGNEDTVFVERSGGYVMSRDEQDSIKEQLRKHQEELGKMKTVATISDNGWRGMSTGAFRKKIVNDLKKTGYRVEKQGVGTIIFDEKLLNRSLNYIETDAEAAAYQALPQVLKRGIEISGHGDHKTRGYETVTIAAPVMLNGIRGNMAVVVMKTKGNRYKVHRVLTPDGETFVLPEKANAVSTSVGGITEAAKTSGAVTPTINTASKFSIPGGREKVKYSISGEGESQTGRTWTREALPAKARDQLDRTERAMVDRLGKAMDVPVKARQTSLREIARELGETYLATGRIDQETADRLFETAWEKGVVEDREYYDQYKPIKDRLRTLPLRISEEDSHDIVDYAHFKKAARGVLRLVKDEGTPVDVAYEEMKQTAPELFPAEITHPADQLVQMYEVARGIQKTEKSLADHYGPEAETYKAYAKNDFCEQVYDAVADWKLVRRYADERAEELEQNAGQVVLVTPEQVKGAWKGLKEDRKAYEKVMAKHLLTDHDKVQVGRLLKGELEPEHLEPGKDNVKGILEVWKAREAYERDRRAIAEWNKGRKDQLRGEADRLLDTANSWKDKKMGLQYAAETMERNIRDIVPDKDLAEEIIQTYFAPVHTAQAESTRLKNRMRQRVKELDLSRKVKNGNLVSEAHAVQLYGEAMDNIQMLKNSRGRMKHRDGKTLQEWESVVTKLWEENPNLDRGKVQRAVEEFRKIYDDLFEQMNEARIRNGYEPTNYRKGYFPHFQPGHTDGITGMFANVLGISTEITALPTTIAGMTHTFKPGIRWFGNAQERLGFNTAYDAVEGFDKYIEGVADVICQTDNIQRLRALASQTRYRTSDEGIRKQVDAVLANESLSDQDKENRIRDIYENGRFALSNFVINLDEYTNLLANKRSLHDRSMEQDFGRKAYNLVRWLEGRVGANMVAINPGSWLTNLIPLTQGGAQLGSGQLMKGMWETLQAYAGKSSQDFVDRSTFLTNRRGSDPLVPRWAELADTNTKPKQVLRKAGEVTGQAGDFLAMGMEYIDNFTADSLVRARYNQNLKRGLSEEAALEEADAWTAGVMADRSKGATPTLFSRTNPGTKLFT